jgi:putative peptide zinc metalloprotease protein
MTSVTTPSLCRAPGVELLGRMEGSGLTEPPYLVRRADGQVVQLSRLLYLMVEHADPGTDLAEIGRRTGDELELRIAPEQVRHVLEHKLAPLGVTADAEGFVAEPPKVDAVLALKMRVGVVGATAVGAIVAPLRHLFRAPVVVLVVAALLAGDVWLLATGGLGDGLNHVIETPALTLVLFALSWLSLAFHELGHAAACRYGGARPGPIGVGLYIVWPVFYSDVTESYRFGRAGRLRVDLGGVYFNAIFALAVMAAYAATGFAPLVLVVVAQHALVLNQFVPWIRLDGYYVVSDLIGVSDLFSRIGPTLRSLLPGRPVDVRVRQLKPWARVAVTTWVVSTVVVIVAAVVVFAIEAPAYAQRAWASLHDQLAMLTRGGIVDVLAGALGVVLLILPIAGLLVTYVLLCTQAGSLVALARCRRLVAHATHP